MGLVACQKFTLLITTSINIKPVWTKGQSGREREDKNKWKITKSFYMDIYKWLLDQVICIIFEDFYGESSRKILKRSWENYVSQNIPNDGYLEL